MARRLRRSFVYHHHAARAAPGGEEEKEWSLEVPKVEVLARVLPTLQPDRRSSSDGLNALTTAQVRSLQPQHETRVFLLRQTPALPPQLRAPLSREVVPSSRRFKSRNPRQLTLACQI